MGISKLLPRSRSPRDYLDLVADPRVDQEVLCTLAASPYSFVRKDGRPYAAALALARRPELDAEEILTLAAQPGASPRMRRGLRRNLAARMRASGSRPC